MTLNSNTMNTKDIFNFNRFGKYFVSDLKTCGANYGLNMLTTTILLPVALYVIRVALHALAYSTWEGPELGLRIFCFGLALVFIVTQMPVKCYGKLTDKQYGSFWITLPASRLEKFISMFIMTCLIAPLTGTALFLGMDSLMCAIDPTCGKSIIVGANELFTILAELGDLKMNVGYESIPVEDPEVIARMLDNLTSPWLYVDEIFGITLPFLLGAIFFKKNKIAKTCLALFGFAMAASLVTAPLTAGLANEILANSIDNPNAALELLSDKYFKNMIMIDVISDTVVNVALMVCIWFRIKTLKH